MRHRRGIAERHQQREEIRTLDAVGRRDDDRRRLFHPVARRHPPSSIAIGQGGATSRPSPGARVPRAPTCVTGGGPAAPAPDGIAGRTDAAAIREAVVDGQDSPPTNRMRRRWMASYAGLVTSPHSTSRPRAVSRCMRDARAIPLSVFRGGRRLIEAIDGYRVVGGGRLEPPTPVWRIVAVGVAAGIDDERPSRRHLDAQRVVVAVPAVAERTAVEDEEPLAANDAGRLSSRFAARSSRRSESSRS